MNDAARAATIDARRIEESTLNCVPVHRQLFYDGWVLRLSPGASKRARSVTALYGSTRPLDEKLAHCEAVYERLGLPCLFRLTPFDVPAHLDAALAARGYQTFDHTLVQVAPLVHPPAFAMPADVDVMPVSPGAFTRALGELKAMPSRQRTIRRAWLADAPLAVRALVAHVDGRVVGVGQASIDDDLAMLATIATADDMRGRGIATAIVGMLLAWAWERNAHHAYLQVTDDNHRALSIYERFGFNTAYAYRYRGRPGQCE